MRWSYLLPRFIFLLLVWAFFFFAFDPILKWSLRKGMEKAAKAKVEIAGVKTTFLHPSFRMTGVTVGSAEEEFTNVVEFSELKFDIAGAPLLEKKFVIDTAQLSGLKFGTPRKTSAKLPFVKEETPKFIADLKAEGKDMAAERLGDLKGEAAGEVKSVEVTPESLTSVKVYQDLQTKYEAQYAELSKKADSSQYQARLDVIKAKVEEANQQKDPLKKAKEFAKIQKDVKQVTEDFKNDRKLIEETAAGLQEGMKAAEEARRKDIEAAMGKMKMPGMDTQSLANMLAGPAMADKTQTALKWLAMARKYMPDNSAKKKAQQTDASRGRNVHFPKENTYPAFLIRKMSVSGEVGLDVPLDFTGTVEGITTQPQVYGKPLTALIKGAKAGRALNFKALLDNTGAIMKGDLSLKYSGMAVKELTLGKPGSIGAAVTGGTGRFDGDVNITGENLRGEAMFRVEGAKVVPQADSIKVAALKTAVLSSMSGLSSVGMGIKIGGTMKEPSITLTTDLADKLAKAFQGAFGAEFAKAKAEAQAKVDAALKPYKSKLESLTGSKQKEIKDKLDAGQKSVSGSGDGILGGLKEKAAPGLGKVKLPKFKF